MARSEVVRIRVRTREWSVGAGYLGSMRAQKSVTKALDLARASGYVVVALSG
jgi:hypothetical protein